MLVLQRIIQLINSNSRLHSICVMTSQTMFLQQRLNLLSERFVNREDPRNRAISHRFYFLARNHRRRLKDYIYDQKADAQRANESRNDSHQNRISCWGFGGTECRISLRCKKFTPSDEEACWSLSVQAKEWKLMQRIVSPRCCVHQEVNRRRFAYVLDRVYDLKRRDVRRLRR